MRIVKMNDRKVTFVKAARELLGDRTVITRQEMLAVREECGLNPTWIKKLKTVVSITCQLKMAESRTVLLQPL